MIQVLKAKNIKSKTVCVSHEEDADGISSAALIKQAFGGTTILVDYPGMMDSIEPLRNDETLKHVFICDLGLNKKNESEFVDLMLALRNRKVKVTYIDHHDLDKKIINQLEKSNVKVIHDTNECTTVQVYNAYKKKLNDHSAFIAACAAITDYMEDRPLGSKLLQIFDRQFALISATVLTYNIVGHQKDPDYLLYLVDELSESKYPHDIPNTYEFAQLQVGKLATVISKVKKSSTLPVVAGFGIKNAIQVKEICSFSDGVVVGSSIIKIIEENLENNKNSILPNIANFIKELKKDII